MFMAIGSLGRKDKQLPGLGGETGADCVGHHPARTVLAFPGFLIRGAHVDSKAKRRGLIQA